MIAFAASRICRRLFAGSIKRCCEYQCHSHDNKAFQLQHPPFSRVLFLLFGLRTLGRVGDFRSIRQYPKFELSFILANALCETISANASVSIPTKLTHVCPPRFCFLRLAINPIRPAPPMNIGSAAGSGVALGSSTRPTLKRRATPVLLSNNGSKPMNGSTRPV